MPSHGHGRPCVITRRATFSASHLYWLPELSDDDNRARFGPCSIAPGHGHNYELIVAMAGPLDADGMVLNLSEVKHAIRSEVTAQLDFRFLNETWPDFDLTLPQGCLPTTEALGLAIWRRLAPQLPLVGLRLFETSNLWADVLADSMEAFLTIRTSPGAARVVPGGQRGDLRQVRPPPWPWPQLPARCDRARFDRSPYRDGLRSGCPPTAGGRSGGGAV